MPLCMMPHLIWERERWTKEKDDFARRPQPWRIFNLLPCPCHRSSSARSPYPPHLSFCFIFSLAPSPLILMAQPLTLLLWARACGVPVGRCSGWLMANINDIFFLFCSAWPKFKITTVTTTCHYICQGNICPGDICPYQEYLSCYWPDLDQTLNKGSWVHIQQITTVSLCFVQLVHPAGPSSWSV